MLTKGDYLSKNVKLPKADPGDLLVVHDTGGYCMALYSKYNSILPSPVYGFETAADSGEIKFFCFKERETVEKTLEFWGFEHPKEA